MENVIQKAIEFAKQAHRNQTSKYSDVSYFDNHLVRVAAKVAEVTDNSEMIAAAYLHDTVEDTETTFKDILDNFGKRIHDLVYGLTEASIIDADLIVNGKTIKQHNRKFRKNYDLQFLAKQNADVQTIKYADMIVNSIDIFEKDSNFARVYIKEKLALFKAMDKGDKKLRKEGFDICNKYMNEMFGSENNEV